MRSRQRARIPARALAGFLVLLLLGGCISPWEQYDESLYQALKYSTPEALTGHSALLQKIIDRSEKEGKNPPPGVLAEYGCCLVEQGEPEEGFAFLDRERELYPESSLFVDVMKRTLSGDETVFEAPSTEGKEAPR